VWAGLVVPATIVIGHPNADSAHRGNGTFVLSDSYPVRSALWRQRCRPVRDSQLCVQPAVFSLCASTAFSASFLCLTDWTSVQQARTLPTDDKGRADNRTEKGNWRAVH
jgi:hypothetical protein